MDILIANGACVRSPQDIAPRGIAILEELKRQNTYGPVPYEELGKISSLGKVQIDRLFKNNLEASPKQIKDKHLLNYCRERLLLSNITIK